MNFKGRMNGTFKNTFDFSWLRSVIINDYYHYYIEEKTLDDIEEDMGWIPEECEYEIEEWKDYMDRSNFIPCQLR